MDLFYMFLGYYLFLVFWIFLLFLNWESFLFILILMEGIFVVMFVFFSNFSILYSCSLDFLYFILSMMVMEGSYGLSMLITFSFSSDNYNYSSGNIF